MMVLILILGLLLGQVDHHAAEYDPFHNHLAVSLGNIEAVVVPDGHVHQYATAHRHGAASPNLATEGPATGQITVAQPRAVSLVAVGDGVPIAPVAVDLMPPVPVAYVVRFATPSHAGVIPIGLDPPPRAV